MTRTTLGVFLLAAAFALAAPAPESRAAEAGSQLAGTGGLVQCVTDCLMQEGRDHEETCRMRCSGEARSRPVDCIGVYKACKKDCDRDKACRKVCKKTLMRCK